MLPSTWIVLLCICTSLALPPAYIKLCPRDEHFDDCVLKSTKDGFKELLKGDKKYKLLSGDPLEVTRIEIVDNGMSLTLIDIKLIGLKNANIQKVYYDFKKEKFQLEFQVPNLQVLGKYTISGKLLVLPITGNGNFNFTLVDSDVKVENPYDFRIINGKRYLLAGSPTVKTVPKRAYGKFENLFNGNKLLGEQMNQFIDANWEEVYAALSPPIVQTVGDAITNIVNKIQVTTPYDELFPTPN